jgi:hypothetical protein
VDRPDKRRTDFVERGGTEPFLRTGGNAGLEFVRGPFGECERDNPGRVSAIDHELCEPLCDDLGLPEPADAMICICELR